MKVDWQKLRERIPGKVHVRRGVHYEVVWMNNDLLPNLCGQTRHDTRQILLNMQQSDRECVHTYFHELAHAFSYEYELYLTESQVQKFEKSLYYILKADNIMKGKR